MICFLQGPHHNIYCSKDANSFSSSKNNVVQNLFCQVNEGLQAIQLEDGSTAIISHSHTESLFSSTVHQLDTSLHLDQLANQVRKHFGNRLLEVSYYCGL